MRKNGNVVWIAPRDELATKEKLQLEANQQIQELEPTRTESFQLNYQRADALQKLLSDPAQRVPDELTELGETRLECLRQDVAALVRTGSLHRRYGLTPH